MSDSLTITDESVAQATEAALAAITAATTVSELKAVRTAH
ncbi:MAG TPA: phenylalanine--tRNA ligase subunit alpha, partial [Terrimesophilobacter sp.]|nr:phenylalanine--tRNA ligase subunit alpha [Terrimesophilobacter sp.]